MPKIETVGEFLLTTVEKLVNEQPQKLKLRFRFSATKL